MKVKFRHDYGVFKVGKTYDVPTKFVGDLIRYGHCFIDRLCRDFKAPNKAMKYSEVTRKGRL